MDLFKRRKISPDFTAVPAERVKDEARIDRLNAQIWEAWRDGDVAYADRLLDMRLAIRPARVCDPADVPVVPGYEDRLDNYGRNPW